MKKSLLILLAVVLGMGVLLTSCTTEPESTEATYQVSVKDAIGTPYTSGVIVKFMQNGQQVAMQVVDANGVASKTMAKGDYTVELMFTGDASQYYYNTKELVLSADKTTLDVILSQKIVGNGTPLFAQSKEYEAFAVKAGCTYVTIKANTRNYFLFTPNTEGTYVFSVPGSSAAIGYYGAPHFVQEYSAAEVTDNQFEISVSASMIGTGDTGTSVFVIGIDGGDTDSNCILAINRTGSAKKTWADEPWLEYKNTTTPAKYVVAPGTSLSDFDLTAATATYQLVKNNQDGYYHLNSENGPLVFVRLTKDPKYIACYKTILESTRVGKYFIDENGELIKKESYVEALMAYIACADENNGVYPLTDDLKYIIQQNGEYAGWWKTDGGNYLFKDDAGVMIPGINHEIAWLVMCCYAA